MTRPSDLTRRSLIDAATGVFAEKGFEAGSVRLITQKARANQAAITYHFDGKEGLYRAVLHEALQAIDEASLIDEAKLPDMDREEALQLFLRQQLLPLLRRNQFTRYLRIFNWEILERTKVFQELVTTEHLPTVAIAQGIVKKFLPETATEEEQILAMIWLVNQAFIFVRNAEHLAKPPTNIKVDDLFVERLIEMLTRLLASGLSGLTRRPVKKVE